MADYLCFDWTRQEDEGGGQCCERLISAKQTLSANRAQSGTSQDVLDAWSDLGLRAISVVNIGNPAITPHTFSD